MPVFIKKINLVWQLSFASNYQFDKQGNCYNVQTGKQLKKTVVGYTVGYCIRGKFMSLKHLRNFLIKIDNEKTPF